MGEDLWTTPLVQGRTVADVGTSLDGDLLGDDPVRAALEAAMAASTSVAERLPGGGTVSLSYGEEQLTEYVHQLAADHLVHAWDLAVATEGDTRLDPHLVSEVAAWFAEREEMYRGGGAIGPRGVSHGGVQAELLAAFGRDAEWGPTHAALTRFSAAFGSGRRRRDHGADDRRLSLRGDRTRSRRRTPPGCRRPPRRLGGGVRADRRTPPSQRRSPTPAGTAG